MSVVKICICMFGLSAICWTVKTEYPFQEQILGSNKPTWGEIESTNLCKGHGDPLLQAIECAHLRLGDSLFLFAWAIKVFRWN